MQEIMSAEKFTGSLGICFIDSMVDKIEMVKDIRSRDSAIIERCKERVRAWMDTPDGNYRHLYDVIDSVLTEIEGE